MKHGNSYTWIPLWIDKWIFGSTRIELNLEERSIWVDFMALAAKDDGYIRANEETPYPIEQLAGLLIVPKDMLRSAIQKFIQTKKIEDMGNGILKIIKWEEYQLSDSYRRVIKHRVSKGLHPTKRGIVTENVSHETESVNNTDTIQYKTKKEDSFIATLRDNIAYQHINIDHELAKMDVWLLLPKNKGRQKTRRFILGWLNKIDAPIETKAKSTVPSKFTEEELLKISGSNLDAFK